VSLFVFFQKRVRVRIKNFKNRVRVRVSFRVRLGFRFNVGIGNVIGGAVGRFGSSLARRLCYFGVKGHGTKLSLPLRMHSVVLNLARDT